MENPTTNTTTPSNPPYLWIGEPKQRTTFGILSFCFSTLIICVWSTLHFSIPTRRHTTILRVFHQVSWMVLALLAPEVLLYLAVNERINAGNLLKQALKLHPHLDKPGMLARMYSYFCGQAKSENKRYHLIQRTSQPHLGLVHAFYALMGGFAFYGSHDDEPLNVEESLFELSTNPRHTAEAPKFDTLVYIMKYFPHIITDITEESILDRAESSSLSKAVLIFQVGWFCTNCASRLTQGLPLSLLEVSTAAHAFCTLLTYFVWWSKPSNIAAPTLMREKGAREVYALLKCSHDEYNEALELAKERAAGGSSTLTGTHWSEKVILAANALQHLLPTPERPPKFSRLERSPLSIPGSVEVRKVSDGYYEAAIMVVCPILYGLLHFLAWGDQFPTARERLLWRISSFVVTCSGFVGVAVAWCILRFDTDRAGPGLALVLISCFLITPTVHMFASGFLIVESFRQLFFLDPAAYQLPSWSNYWPHFS